MNSQYHNRKIQIMKKSISVLAVLLVMTMAYTPKSLSGEVNYYKLKTCTGMDPQGNTFDGAMCKDKVDDGPCDKESICYEPEDVIPY